LQYQASKKERLGVEEAAADDRGYNAKRRSIAHEIWRGKKILRKNIFVFSRGAQTP
jgi:hypothetical protein